MPRVDLISPVGDTYTISTRSPATLRAWFDEVLPWVVAHGRLGGELVTYQPWVQVWPMWAWGQGPPTDPDWITDTRALGRRYEFPVKTGAAALAELERIRRALELELEQSNRVEAAK